MINKVVQLPNGYIVNDLFFIQEGVPMYQEILDWIADGGQVDEYIAEQPSQEMLLESAKSKKIAEVEIYKNQQFGKPLLVRASNGSENPDYYLKPSPDYNIFLAGSSMSENETKEWRAFDIDGNKLNKENGDPLTLEVTKSELMSVSNHYELRKTQEYNQRDLKVARINKLTTFEEVEAFDVNEIIV